MVDNEEKTPVSPIPRRTIRLKTIQPVSGAPSVAPAAPAAPAPAMSQVPPTETAVAPAAAPVTDTSRLSRRTIKLVPQTQASAPSAPSSPTVRLTTEPASAPSAPTIKLDGVAVGTDTSKLSRRTIKLMPQTQSAAPAAASSPTINLNSAPAADAPVSTSTAKIPKQTAAAAPASAPSIQANRPASRPGFSTATIKLTKHNTQIKPAGTPSAPTIKLDTPAPAAAMQKPAAPSVSVAPMPPVVKEERTSLALVISSAVALVAVGFLCYMMFAQYSNFYNGSNISVPGLTQNTVR